VTRVHRVKSGDVSLHVVEAGERGKPPVLLVHGFPDCHEVYSHVVDELSREFHVATFDLRGVAKSTPPRDPSGYRIEAILEDITAVIDHVFGRTAKVHLVGHDWGSVLCFSYIAEGRDKHRARSFTSASGPHVRLMWNAVFRNATSLGLRGAVTQAFASWYVFAMHLPVVPESLFRYAGPYVFRRVLELCGVPKGDAYLDITREQVLERTLGTMNLYRQNALRPPPMPAPRSITVPIRLLLPIHDPFVRPETFAFLRDFATDLEVRRVDANHWIPRSHPALFASEIRSHVERIESKTSQPMTAGKS